MNSIKMPVVAFVSLLLSFALLDVAAADKVELLSDSASVLPYQIWDVIVDNNTAIVDMSASSTCVLIVTLYDKNGQMLQTELKYFLTPAKIDGNFCPSLQSTASGPQFSRMVSVPFSSGIPANSYAKAILLNSATWKPLCAPKTSSANGEETVVGSFSVKGGISGSDYSYANHVLSILTATPLVIRNTNPNLATTDTICINENINANVTLAGVNIDVSDFEQIAAFQIADSSKGNVTLTLARDSVNTLKSGKRCAGLQKNGDSDSGTLTILGTGSLEAVGGKYAAGIGGGEFNGGNGIKISDGKIDAIGGKGAAGIGGGYVQNVHFNIDVEDNVGTGNYDGNTADITILDGEVTAQGGTYGSGIGGGCGGYHAVVTISGGKIEANKDKSVSSTGIGGGYSGSCEIRISGGTIDAGNIDSTSTGIGSGDGAIGANNITISGGTITTYGGGYHAGIGGKDDRNTTITITGGVIDASCERGGAAIGGASTSSTDTKRITISGGIITAIGYNQGTGIGAGGSGKDNKGQIPITITGGTVTAFGYFNKPTSSPLSNLTYATGIGGGGFLGENQILIQGDCLITAHLMRFVGYDEFIVGNGGFWNMGTNPTNSNWRGVIFADSNGRIYGNTVTIKTDANIPSGHTLTIKQGQTLTISDGVSFVNNGIIKAYNANCIVGTVIGNQPIVDSTLT